jgi:SAM-dependent methyltransferase
MQEEELISYFNTRQRSAPGIGTSLDIEMPYRHFWELDTLKKFLPMRQPLSFFEYGCGAGRWALSLAPIASLYVGIDLSPELIVLAKEDAAMEGYKHLFFTQVKIQDYVFEDNKTFDVMYTAGVTQYLNDDELRTLIKSALGNISENGVFIDRSTVVIDCGRLIRSTDQYFSIYRTPEEIRSIFEEFNLVCVGQERSYCPLSMPRLWSNAFVRKSIEMMHTRFPSLIFHIMRYISVIAEKVLGSERIEADGVSYRHVFLVFKKQ